MCRSDRGGLQRVRGPASDPELRWQSVCLSVCLLTQLDPGVSLTAGTVAYTIYKAYLHPSYYVKNNLEVYAKNS